jgi:hypothetical protein
LPGLVHSKNTYNTYTTPTSFPNRGNRKLWVPFDHVVRVGHDAATGSQDRRPRRQSSAPSAPSRAVAMAAKRTSAAKAKPPPAKRPRERKPTSQSDRSSTVMKEQPKQPRRESGFQGRKRRHLASVRATAEDRRNRMCSSKHIHREWNSQADKLANMDVDGFIDSVRLVSLVSPRLQ